MPETSRRTTVEIPWRTIFKLIAAAALVWVWLKLVELALVVLVAVLIAVTLKPVVGWFERRGWPRWAAAALISLLLLVGIGGFGWFTWTSISEQARFASQHVTQLERQLFENVPGWLLSVVGVDSADGLQSAIVPYALRLGRSAVSAIVVSVLASILTMYLLIEAERTRDWLIAFVPKAERRRAAQTLDEAERVIFAYVAGNVLTSVLATLFVLVLLSVLKVPAALLLALIAGLFDFVPVIGFIASSIFAVAMALTVSPSTALIVAALYVVYHLVENYVISPWAYGDRLKLSNVAVILAFAIGGALAGVIGALIALPVAAAYPAIERIWLREQLPEETVREHQAIEQRKAG
jgi:predicted PurR-regulated permease PerM